MPAEGSEDEDGEGCGHSREMGSLERLRAEAERCDKAVKPVGHGARHDVMQGCSAEQRRKAGNACDERHDTDCFIAVRYDYLVG